MWVAWKQRSTLAGDEAELEGTVPLFAGEVRLGRKGLIFLTVGAVLGACLVCLAGMLLLSPPPG